MSFDPFDPATWQDDPEDVAKDVELLLAERADDEANIRDEDEFNVGDTVFVGAGRYHARTARVVGTDGDKVAIVLDDADNDGLGRGKPMWLDSDALWHYHEDGWDV